MEGMIEKLNKMRLERNLSVYRLAELSGINQSTLANTFSRGTLPSIANLELICDTMGITLSQFFQEDETEIKLSLKEREMINDYRKLPEEVRVAVFELIKRSSENLQ